LVDLGAAEAHELGRAAQVDAPVAQPRAQLDLRTDAPRVVFVALESERDALPGARLEEGVHAARIEAHEVEVVVAVEVRDEELARAADRLWEGRADREGKSSVREAGREHASRGRLGAGPHEVGGAVEIPVDRARFPGGLLLERDVPRLRAPAAELGARVER